MDHDNFHGITTKLINVRPLNTPLWSNGQSVDLINSLANAYPLYRGISQTTPRRSVERLKINLMQIHFTTLPGYVSKPLSGNSVKGLKINLSLSICLLIYLQKWQTPEVKITYSTASFPIGYENERIQFLYCHHKWCGE